MFVILTEMFCMTYDLHMTAKFLITSKYFKNVGKYMNGDRLLTMTSNLYKTAKFEITSKILPKFWQICYWR